jgi:hypothetical protein
MQYIHGDSSPRKRESRIITVFCSQNDRTDNLLNARLIELVFLANARQLDTRTADLCETLLKGVMKSSNIMPLSCLSTLVEN